MLPALMPYLDADGKLSHGMVFAIAEPPERRHVLLLAAARLPALRSE